MVRRCTAAIVLVFFLHIEFVQPDQQPEIETGKGRIRGFNEKVDGKSVDTFLGIPFAKPPINNRRFTRPAPPKPWTHTIDATKAPNSCVQAPDTYFGDFHGAQAWNPNTNISEDCLYLNVWAPRSSKSDDALPVMVWIFGGGFTTGTSTLDVYDGKVFVSQNDVILVSIQYRLGFLGFMYLGIDEAPGNAGLLDQILAMKWIKENIRRFGGDPDKITIFGESAGSVSVSLHLMLPASRDLFNQAVMQSGSANARWSVHTAAEGKMRTLNVSKTLGCDNGVSALEVVKCLRKVKADRFPNNEYISSGPLQYPFVPVIDGEFILEDPSAVLKKRTFKKCPILIGSNSDEGSWFLVYAFDKIKEKRYYNITHPVPVDRKAFTESIQYFMQNFPKWPLQIGAFAYDAILHEYTNWSHIADDLSNRKGVIDAVGDYNLICPCNEFANYYANAGQKVYGYRYTHRSTQNPWPKWMGVMHGDEIPFIFGQPLNQKFQYTTREKQFSSKIMEFWSNFAKTGDPNGEGVSATKQWPMWTSNKQEYLNLNAERLKTEQKPRIRQCAFWERYVFHLMTATEEISDVEREWKLQFQDWKMIYLPEWKKQYETFINNRDNKCEG